jgi:hypothetical protein
MTEDEERRPIRSSNPDPQAACSQQPSPRREQGEKMLLLAPPPVFRETIVPLASRDKGTLLLLPGAHKDRERAWGDILNNFAPRLLWHVFHLLNAA